MAGTKLHSQWKCLEPGCPESGEDTPKLTADKAAERHGKAAQHATVSWAEPMLPIKVGTK